MSANWRENKDPKTLRKLEISLSLEAIRSSSSAQLAKIWLIWNLLPTLIWTKQIDAWKIRIGITYKSATLMFLVILTFLQQRMKTRSLAFWRWFLQKIKWCRYKVNQSVQKYWTVNARLHPFLRTSSWAKCLERGDSGTYL